MKNIGQKELPYLIQQSSELPLYLQNYEVAPDNLHNGKGVAKTSLDIERNQKQWDEDKFLRLLAKYIGRAQTSSLKGSDWRLMVVHYKEIVLPCISNLTRRAYTSKFFQTLAEIQWIAYGQAWFRSFRGIKLRLHVLCFQLSIWASVLYQEGSKSAGMLYFHTIISHYADWYEKYDFKIGSTEYGERFFTTIKRIMLR